MYLRRKLLLATLAAGPLLVVLLGLLEAGPRRRAHIDRAACDRIRPGMSEAEVEAIPGGPPGDTPPARTSSPRWPCGARAAAGPRPG
jgi:hypothetical protein